MKRFLLEMLMLTPLCAFAQSGMLNGSNYYRVQNSASYRYITIVDTRVYKMNTTNVDMSAMYMVKQDDFDEKVLSNPASVCYIDVLSPYVLNLKGQGLDLSNYDYALNYLYNSGQNGYRLYGAVSGISFYLVDQTGNSPAVSQSGAMKTAAWSFRAVDQSDSQCFGVKADVHATADDSYWATMYAGFSFTPSAETTKVYSVYKVDKERKYAVIREVTGNIPEQAPVLFRCSSDKPLENKLTLLTTSSGNMGTNLLRGNYYCNDITDVSADRPHRNVTAYTPSTMRMLGTTSDGKPAFVKSNISYLPANKCYLQVSSDTPDVLEIITEEEYTTGIEEVTTSTANDTPKVIYDLQGRRVQAPSKGLYIVNGKKVVVK